MLPFSGVNERIGEKEKAQAGKAKGKREVTTVGRDWGERKKNSRGEAGSGGAFCFEREKVRRIPARKACCGERRAKEIKSGEKMADRFAAGRKDSGRKE